MPCHLLLAKLAGAAPGPVLASLDKLVGPLEKTLTTRLRGEPVKQEVWHTVLMHSSHSAVCQLQCAQENWKGKTGEKRRPLNERQAGGVHDQGQRHVHQRHASFSHWIVV